MTKKIPYIYLIAILFCSCTNKNSSNNRQVGKEKKDEIVSSKFQTILDEADVNGSILIYDEKEDKYFSNDFQWANKGKLPASTFKIPNSIIALETGIVENDSTLFEWDGKKRGMKAWERDLLFKQAFQFSCVPCYQDVARKIGHTRMNEQLDKLRYGEMNVEPENIDMFWLEGKSRINQFQQIDFLKRLYESKLPISERSEIIIKKMMLLEDNEVYKLSGKTGWSVSNENDNGWFVGKVENQNKSYFFATNVEPTPKFDMDQFPAIRKEVTMNAFKQMKFIDFENAVPKLKAVSIYKYKDKLILVPNAKYSGLYLSQQVFNIIAIEKTVKDIQELIDSSFMQNKIIDAKYDRNTSAQFNSKLAQSVGLDSHKEFWPKSNLVNLTMKDDSIHVETLMKAINFDGYVSSDIPMESFKISDLKEGELAFKVISAFEKIESKN